VTNRVDLECGEEWRMGGEACLGLGVEREYMGVGDKGVVMVVAKVMERGQSDVHQGQRLLR